ncbi:MAG: outer membrane protein assembly factor BamE [Pseudomonadota bacterium]
MMLKAKFALIGAVSAVVLSACSAIFSTHGYVPPEEELDQLVLGVDTRASVEQLLGPAQSGGYFIDGDLYYIQSEIRTFAYRAPEVIERDILAISFDDNDTLENIETYTLADGRIINIARRETKLPVKSQSFLAQILGNIGNINPGDFFN